MLVGKNRQDSTDGCGKSSEIQDGFLERSEALSVSWAIDQLGTVSKSVVF